MVDTVRAEVRLAGELALTNLAAPEVAALAGLRTAPGAASLAEEPRLDLLAGAVSGLGYGLGYGLGQGQG